MNEAYNLLDRQTDRQTEHCKQDPLISVIVPVYRVEKYISRCIGSILQQTYKNLEIILIDDGSPDKSGEICDVYAEKDDRIKVIHKRNGGVSSARNVGIDIATGKYIMFVDSDDWLPKTSINVLKENMDKYFVDLVVAGYEARASNITVKKPTQKLIEFSNIEEKDIISITTDSIFYAPWGKLFDSDIIQKNNLRFNERIKFGEDALFVREYLSCIKRIFISDSVVYYYNQLNGLSASGKCYLDINEWSLSSVQAYQTLLNSFNCTEIIKDSAIANHAFGRVCFCVSMYVRNCKKAEAIKHISGTLDLLYPYLILNRSWENKKDSLTNVRKCVARKDVNELYEIYKKITKKRFTTGIKRIVLKIVAPIIERIRDGLR